MPVWRIKCASCGNGVSAEVVSGWPLAKKPNVRQLPPEPKDSTLWLRCPDCGEGSVKLKDGSVYPTAPAGGAVKGLPLDVEGAWREVRIAQAVGAYTASEMMCRKILMHVAVDVAKATPGEKFVYYIDALESGNYLATGTKPAVDKIRGRGNDATHELPASTEEQALNTLGVTEYLLRGIYEFRDQDA